MDPKTKKNAKSKTTKKVAPKKTTETAYQSAPIKSEKNVTKNKKLAFVGLVAVFIILALALYYKNVFVAATVNGQPITRITVVKQLESQNGKQVLDSLVTQTLILQEAKKRGIVITQTDINTELDKINKNVQANGTTLDQALAAQGMTKSELIQNIKIQLAIQKMVGNKFSVSQKEINDYVTQAKAQLPTSSTTTDAQLQTEAKAQLMQQKQQAAMQTLIAKLQKEAKIKTYVNY